MPKTKRSSEVTQVTELQTVVDIDVPKFTMAILTDGSGNYWKEVGGEREPVSKRDAMRVYADMIRLEHMAGFLSKYQSERLIDLIEATI